MAQFLGFGSGSDGVASLSGTDNPVDSSFPTTSAGATGATINSGLSIAANDFVFIHQSRGSAAGTWEVVQVATYDSGTGAITFTSPLANSYTDSGADQAQIIKMPEYSSVTISSTLTAKAWTGDVGGIIVFMCNGKTTITSTVTAQGRGYRLASGSSGDANAGEGTAGDVVNQRTANGNGGGGGSRGPDGGHVEGGHGGGGGNSAAGTGGNGKNTATPGAGGNAVGTSTLTTMCFGGGGGGGGGMNSGSPAGDTGANGGGIVIIFSSIIEVSGSINVKGNDSPGNSTGAGCGGGGAGGSIFIKAVTATIGTNLLDATKGIGGTSTGAFGGKGGDGADGRIRIECCSLNGSSNPTASTQTGGFSFCGSAVQII